MAPFFIHICLGCMCVSRVLMSGWRPERSEGIDMDSLCKGLFCGRWTVSVKLERFTRDGACGGPFKRDIL